MGNLSSTRNTKPAFNGSNSQTAAAPAPNQSAKDAPRNKVTGTQVPKTPQANLPLNRARAILAKVASSRAVAKSAGKGGKMRALSSMEYGGEG